VQNDERRRSAVQTLKAPPSEHERFDALCARIGDWEPMLAAPFTPPLDVDLEDKPDDDAGPIDDLILAGLVAPY
jgi:hypothetical protein